MVLFHCHQLEVRACECLQLNISSEDLTLGSCEYMNYLVELCLEELVGMLDYLVPLVHA